MTRREQVGSVRARGTDADSVEWAVEELLREAPNFLANDLAAKLTDPNVDEYVSEVEASELLEALVGRDELEHVPTTEWEFGNESEPTRSRRRYRRKS